MRHLILLILLTGCAKSPIQIEKAEAASVDQKPSYQGLTDVQRIDAKIDRLERLVSQLAQNSQTDRTAVIQYSQCQKNCEDLAESYPKDVPQYDNETGDLMYHSMSEEHSKAVQQCWKFCEKSRPLTVASPGC